MDLNRILDRVPRLTVDIGHRRVPAFRSAGIVGFQLAAVVTVLVSLVNGLGPAVALGVSATAGMSFFGWGLLRRALTHKEELVLIEYVWVGLGCVGGFLWVSGTPYAAGLDLMSVAVCIFLAAGRTGCAMVGCCHGALASTGLLYGTDHGLPARLTGRRLLPVQLVEAGGLLMIGIVGFALAAGTPGRATVWFLVSYAVLRFGCEALRADVRPTLLGLSVARVSCAVQLGVGLLLAEYWLLPGRPGRELTASAAALVLAAGCGVALVRVRRPGPLVSSAALDETWDLVVALARVSHDDAPVVATTSLGLRVALTPGDQAVHVSLSHPNLPTVPVGLALGGDPVAHGRGVTHLTLPLLTSRPSGPPGTATAAPTRPGDAGGSGANGYFDRFSAPAELLTASGLPE